MHVVFKDRLGRVVGAETEIDVEDDAGWLPREPSVTTCEVYDDDRTVRRCLVAVYERDEGDGGRWRRTPPPSA